MIASLFCRQSGSCFKRPGIPLSVKRCHERLTARARKPSEVPQRLCSTVRKLSTKQRIQKSYDVKPWSRKRLDRCSTPSVSSQVAVSSSESSIIQDLQPLLGIVQLATQVAADRVDDVLRSENKLRCFLFSCAEIYACTELAVTPYPQYADVKQRIRSVNTDLIQNLEENFDFQSASPHLSRQHVETVSCTHEMKGDYCVLASLPLSQWPGQVRKWEKAEEFDVTVWKEISDGLLFLLKRRVLTPTQQVSIALVFLRLFRSALTSAVLQIEQRVNSTITKSTSSKTLSILLTTYASVLGGDSVHTVLARASSRQLRDCDASLLLSVYIAQKRCRRKQTGTPEDLACEIAAQLTWRVESLTVKQQRSLVKHFSCPVMNSDSNVQSMFDEIARLHQCEAAVEDNCKLLELFAASFYFSSAVEGLCREMEVQFRAATNHETLMAVMNAFAAVRYRPSQEFLTASEVTAAEHCGDYSLDQLSQLVSAYSTLNYRPAAWFIDRLTTRVFVDLAVAQDEDVVMDDVVKPEAICSIMWHLACLWALNHMFFDQVQEVLHANYILHPLPISLLYITGTVLAVQSGSGDGPEVLRFGSHMYDSASLWAAQLAEYRQLPLPDEERSTMRTLLIQVLSSRGLGYAPDITNLRAWTDFHCQVQSAVAAVTGELSLQLARVSTSTQHVPIPATAVVTARHTKNIAIFADGPGCFIANRCGVQTAAVALRDEVLTMSRWVPVSVSWRHWPSDKKGQHQYLASLLKDYGVLKT